MADDETDAVQPGAAPPTRTLLLLRHAKADRPHGVVDHERPLSLEGRRQAAQVGARWAAAGLLPDVVWCSSALRTRQTWELVARSSGAEARLLLSDDVYDAGAADLVELLRTTPADARTVAVVGHEPSISTVSAVLAALGSDPAAVAQVRAGVPTAAWSVLRPYDGWSELGRGRARLLAVHRP
ncbi:SixA phosphatase family protein [Cellulomonas sp. SG140]|uniref:SixA phosphatase family protein n=1 Tax=Cellulomonas sp. SG140 TaxID=2976536 RepID=UPI0021E8BF09|nr:histidine phosphatase family protein [Cellulomonas sp. SG140]